MSDAVLEQPTGAQENTQSLSVHTIPMEFYGGKNPAPPEIPVAQTAAPTQTVVVPATPKVAPRTAAPVVTPANAMTQPPKQNKTILIVAVVTTVLVLGGGIGAWFYLQPAPAAEPQPVPVAVTPTSTPEPEPVPVVEATSTPEIVVATSTPEVVTLVPSHAFTDSADSDGDGLTDIEEELWSTDPAKTDSDGDTYTDQTELLNLYDPTVANSGKLVDSKLIASFINPTIGYSIIYPTSWVSQSLDNTTKQEVLLTSVTGEYVHIQAIPFPKDQTFPQWFAQNIPNELLSTYVPFVNRFFVSGIMSPDKTVAIIADTNYIYVIRYDGGTRSEINYRTSFRTIVQSFKPSGVVSKIDISVAPLNSTEMTATTTPLTTASSTVMVTTTPAVMLNSTTSTLTGTTTTTKP